MITKKKSMEEKALVTPGLRERAIHLRAVLLRLSGFDAFGKERNRPSTVARMIVCNQLYSEGHTETDIARVMGKNHSTINYYRQRIGSLYTPGWEAERELWERFKKEI